MSRAALVLTEFPLLLFHWKGRGREGPTPGLIRKRSLMGQHLSLFPSCCNSSWDCYILRTNPDSPYWSSPIHTASVGGLDDSILRKYIDFFWNKKSNVSLPLCVLCVERCLSEGPALLIHVRVWTDVVRTMGRGEKQQQQQRQQQQLYSKPAAIAMAHTLTHRPTHPEVSASWTLYRIILHGGRSPSQATFLSYLTRLKWVSDAPLTTPNLSFCFICFFTFFINDCFGLWPNIWHDIFLEWRFIG